MDKHSPQWDNIALVCLDNDFCKHISQQLADVLDMFFADCKEYIEYDLIDSGAILEKCGVKYLEERERKAMKDFTKFQNTVLSVSYDYFHANRDLFSRSAIIYLARGKNSLPEKESINIISFLNRDEYLRSYATLTVEIKNKSDKHVIKDIKKGLGELL